MSEVSYPHDHLLDLGIKDRVEVLQRNNIETYESCEGGNGHAFANPTIRFHGDKNEGYRATAILLQNRYDISALHRLWHIIDGELVGPTWEIIFPNITS